MTSDVPHRWQEPSTTPSATYPPSECPAQSVLSLILHRNLSLSFSQPMVPAGAWHCRDFTHCVSVNHLHDLPAHPIPGSESWHQGGQGGRLHISCRTPESQGGPGGHAYSVGAGMLEMLFRPVRPLPGPLLSLYLGSPFLVAQHLDGSRTSPLPLFPGSPGQVGVSVLSVLRASPARCMYL